MHSLWISDAGGFLRYHDVAGAAPARLYIHGLGCAGTSDWPHVVASGPLAGHRSILVDLFGYGYSDRPERFSYTMEAHADALAALLDHLALERVDAIGHSMGGSIAILLTERRPDLVARLVVAEPNLDPGPGMISGRIAGSTAETFASSGHRQIAASLDAAARKGDAGAAAYAASFRLASPQALHASATSLIADRTPTYRSLLKGFSIPRTYVYGSRSNEDMTGLAESGVDIRCIADAGHSLMIDNPVGFAAAVADRLR